MASHDGETSDTSAAPRTSDDDTSAQHQGPGRATGPPSIISSRMTDIGTEDGRDFEPRDSKRDRDSRGPSRTETAYTARSHLSAQRTPAAARSQPTALARRPSAKRTSMATSTGGSSTATGGRPASSASRSHVPSVSSSNFFRPMSSQKLQAQRSATRPSTMSRHMEVADHETEAASVIGANVIRHSINSNSPSAQNMTDEPPPSRGTEMTGRDTYDRTANTANTRDSVTDSVRPLHKKPAEDKGLTVEMPNNNFDNRGQPSPLTPHSIRSSFMLRNHAGSHASNNRDRDGVEKLASADSSPEYQNGGSRDRPETGAASKPVTRKNGPNAKVWEYFTGNTIFCMGGRFQNTRSRPVNIATGAFVVIPCVLFFVFSAHDLWYEISPAVPIVFAYLAFICVSSFLHASVSDPGVSPPPPHPHPSPPPLGTVSLTRLDIASQLTPESTS